MTTDAPKGVPEPNSAPTDGSLPGAEPNGVQPQPGTQPEPVAALQSRLHAQVAAAERLRDEAVSRATAAERTSKGHERTIEELRAAGISEDGVDTDHVEVAKRLAERNVALEERETQLQANARQATLNLYSGQYGIPISELDHYSTPEQMEAAAERYRSKQLTDELEIARATIAERQAANGGTPRANIPGAPAVLSPQPDRGGAGNVPSSGPPAGASSTDKIQWGLQNQPRPEQR